MGVGLKSDQVCAKALPLITPTTMCVIGFGGDSASRDHIKIDIECPLNGMHKKKLGLKSALILVNIARDILRRFFCGESCRERKIFLADITNHTHSQ